MGQILKQNKVSKIDVGEAEMLGACQLQSWWWGEQCPWKSLSVRAPRETGQVSMDHT